MKKKISLGSKESFTNPLSFKELVLGSWILFALLFSIFSLKSKIFFLVYLFLLSMFIIYKRTYFLRKYLYYKLMNTASELTIVSFIIEKYQKRLNEKFLEEFEFQYLIQKAIYEYIRKTNSILYILDKDEITIINQISKSAAHSMFLLNKNKTLIEPRINYRWFLIKSISYYKKWKNQNG